MLTQLLSTLIITNIIPLPRVHSYSACDDIDIHFIIDTDSIIQNVANVEQFIQSIIWNGTSEYTAISISLYGDHIPSGSAFSSVIISLHETHSIYQRTEHYKKVLSQLQNALTAIASSKSTEQTRISLLDAFAVSNDQSKPMRISKKESVFAPDKDESRKIDEYFIFDHDNKLLANNHDICSIIYHDRVRNKNIHFIMGKTFTPKSMEIQCKHGNAFYDRINHRTFFALPDIMDIANHKQLETVLDITCPTDININEDYEYGSGGLSLGNHVQWIDTDDIQKCNLVEIKNNEITAPFQIDSKSSYIHITNYNHIESDNTYKINDYLLVHKHDSKFLSKLGCWSQVYKVVDIQPDVVGSTAKVFISLPSSPTEYIMRASVSGQHPLFTIKNVGKTPSKSAEDTPDSRRLLTRYIRNGPARDLFSNLTSGTFDLEASLATPTTIDLGFPWDIDIIGTGSINASVDFAFDIDFALNFTFDWDLLKDSIYLYFTLNADYAFAIDLDIGFQGQLSVSIDDLIKYGSYHSFFLGVVPVVIKPFIDIDLSLTTLATEIEVGISCKYGGYDQIGYEYDYQNNYKPNFDIIKADTKYLLAIIQQWEDVVSIEDCASLSYSFDNIGQGCRFFDYNPTTQLCRCAGAGPVAGFTSADPGTTAYILNSECEGIYKIDCQLLQVCSIGDITVSSSIEGCSLGLISYECKSCTSNPGGSEITQSEESIKLRTPSPDNGCTYTSDLSMSLNDQDLTTCPRSEDATELIGFDTDIDISIGANLYSIIFVYLRGILYIPLRINIPEFNDDVCAGVSLSCDADDTQSITASIDLLMNLTLYLGVDADVTSLINIVGNLINLGIVVDIDGLDFESPSIESLLGEFEILPLTNVGCLPFAGNTELDQLDTLVRGLCCMLDSETGLTVPIFIDNDNDGIDDRTEATNGNYGGNAKSYKVSVFALLTGFMCLLLECIWNY